MIRMTAVRNRNGTTMRSYLDFEKPVAELEARADELRALAGKGEDHALADEIARLDARASQALRELYGALTPWQKTLVARHPQRPHFSDYCAALIDEFTPLAGDRAFGEDEAIVGGFGRFRGEPVCIIGHEKGDSTETRIRHNFGMPKPEGYRKAARLMELADRFGLPVLSLIDTAGAYPGIEAEERGQAEAIARSTEACLSLRTPSVALVIGEGGSGGALGIAVADRVAMMEHAWYSVISPEGCAAILWKQANEQTNTAAATALRLTARDNLSLGIIEAIVPEPLGGAHRDPGGAAQSLAGWVSRTLVELAAIPTDELVARRYERFRRMGKFSQTGEAG